MLSFHLKFVHTAKLKTLISLFALHYVVFVTLISLFARCYFSLSLAKVFIGHLRDKILMRSDLPHSTK